MQLRGTSLGGWLLVESYMNGLPGVEQHQREALGDVLGPVANRAFWDAFQDSYYDEPDIAWLAAKGFNLLRLPFNWRLFTDDARTGRSRERGFALLDRVFAWAERHGMFVLLDLHAAPGSQADDWNADGTSGEKRFWYEPHLQQWTAALWVELATRYRHHPALFGYDPLCEPVWHDREAVNAWYRLVQGAIRSVDPTGLITLEPNLWAREASTLDPALFADPHTIVHGHWYPFAKELAGLTAWPDAANPLNLWAAIEATLAPWHRDRPALLGEFGLMHGRWDGAAHHALITDLVRQTEAHGVHWCVWAAKDIGQIGLLSPTPDSPWRAFLAQPAIANTLNELNRLAGVTFGEVMAGGELQARTTALFPDEDPDLCARITREAQRHLEHLGARHVARHIATLSDSDRLALARGFAFEHCRPHAGLVAALSA